MLRETLLGVLLTAGKSGPGGVDWSNLGIALWMLLFAALPFINRDRMRGGDCSLRRT